MQIERGLHHTSNVCFYGAAALVSLACFIMVGGTLANSSKVGWVGVKVLGAGVGTSLAAALLMMYKVHKFPDLRMLT